MYTKSKFTPTAQTQLDFVIGVGIFFVALSIVLAGSGTLLQPFTTGQENIATSDRVADKMINTYLTTGETQYVLDRDCTVTFFSSVRNGSELTPNEDCRFDTIESDETLTDIFGVPSTYYIQITIEDSSGVVTLDGTKMEVGQIPDTGTTTLSQRTVRIDDEVYYAYIRVTR